MSRKSPLFAAVGAMAVGIGLATGAQAQLDATLDVELKCEDLLAQGDLETLAVIAATEGDPRREWAEECLASIEPALGPLDYDPDGGYSG